VSADTWFAPDVAASLETIRRVRDEPPPTPSVAGWLYPGSTATIFGEPDTGKSMLAAATAQRVVHDGGQVVWLDYEMGERRVIERLLAFGLSDVDIAENVFRLHSPTGLPPAEFAEQFAGVMLMVVDSFTGPLSAFGGSSNTDTDVETAYAAFLRPLARSGTSVLTLDHVVKRKDDQGRWAVGSQRKLGAPDLAYSFDKVHRFRPGMGGAARLKMARDRAGGIDTIEFTLEPDMSWQLKDGSGEFRPTGKMELISRFLEGNVDPVSTASIESGVTGGSDVIRKALDELAAGDYIRVHRGEKNANLHASKRRYREASDPQRLCSPLLASSSPKKREASTSCSPRPYVVGEQAAASKPQIQWGIPPSSPPDDHWLAHVIENDPEAAS
jgi:hypothetical protein